MTNEEIKLILDEQKRKRKRQTTIALAAIFGFIFLMIIVAVTSEDSKPTNAEPALTVEQMAEKKANEIATRKEQLKREIESIKKGINFDKYKVSFDQLNMEVAILGAWFTLVNEAKNSNDGEHKQLGEQLEKLVSKTQVKEFPLMRAAYTKLTANVLWENDIYVSASNNGNKVINFTGGVFATNKNIKEAQDGIHSTLMRFRFSESRYRWYKAAEEYTYYKTEAPNDADVVQPN